MFENLGHFFKRMVKTEQQKELGSKDAAKERLHLVLMQDRANVSADFLEMMKQEIIEVIKKYVNVPKNENKPSLGKTNKDFTKINDTTIVKSESLNDRISSFLIIMPNNIDTPTTPKSPIAK